MTVLRFEDEAVVEVLTGLNTIRDGYLERISAREYDYRLVVELGFYVPDRSLGNYYDLRLSDVQDIDYCFTRDRAASQIGSLKCIWTAQEEFYLSLDPWLESEMFASAQDADCFRAKHVQLAVTRKPEPQGATFR
jgi:hypothetical protein